MLPWSLESAAAATALADGATIHRLGLTIRYRPDRLTECGFRRSNQPPTLPAAGPTPVDVEAYAGFHTGR